MYKSHHTLSSGPYVKARFSILMSLASSTNISKAEKQRLLLVEAASPSNGPGPQHRHPDALSSQGEPSISPPRPPPPPPFLIDFRQPLWPQVLALAQHLLDELRQNPQFVRTLLLGQLLSFLIAIMGCCSELLANNGVDLPTFQGFLNYVLLALVYGGQMVLARLRPCQDLWKYALLAFLDVEANFLLVKAYQFTSITSVTLLDCFTIPAVIFLSRIFLYARYNRGHYAGATACLVGLALLVISDHASSTVSAPHPLLGDVLVLLGAIMYAVSNVSQERLLTHEVPVKELLGYLGLFGAVIGGVQFGIFEGHRIGATQWSHGTALPFLGFSGALFAFYSLVPKMLVSGGATALNLSLLTSDVWAALARVVFFDGFSPQSGFLFAIAFLFVAAGLVVYTLSGPSRDERVHATAAAAAAAAKDELRQPPPENAFAEVWADPSQGPSSLQTSPLLGPGPHGSSSTATPKATTGMSPGSDSVAGDVEMGGLRLASGSVGHSRPGGDAGSTSTGQGSAPPVDLQGPGAT